MSPAWTDPRDGGYGVPQSSIRQNYSDDSAPTTNSSSTYVPRDYYDDVSARRRHDASDVVVIPGDGRDRTRFDRTCYREEPRYYRRDRSETRYETAAPERSSHATYETGLGGRSSHATYENGLGSRSPHSTAEAVISPKSQYDHPDPRNQPDSRFLALEVSAARRRRNGTANVTSDSSTSTTIGDRPDVPVGFPPQVTASRSRAVIEDDSDRRAGSRYMVEDDGDRRAGSRYVVEDVADRRAGSRFVVEDVADRRAGSRFVVEDVPDRREGNHFVVEERPDRRQGSQFVVNEPPERAPYYSPYDRGYDMEREYVPYPRRQSSMERVALPELDRTSPRQQYVVLRDRHGRYLGIDKR